MKVLQMPAASSARRRALCIGVDEYTRAPLRGAVSDAERWAEVLEGRGFDVTLLRNEEATRQRVLDEIWMHVEYARPGDRVAIAFAGHGTRDVDRTNDTAIVCADVEDGGIVLDDEIGEAMAAILPGASVTLFFDCCHSGTMSGNGFVAREWSDSMLRTRQLNGDPAIKEAFARLAKFRGRRKRAMGRWARTLGTALLMREVCLAACGDHELAYEVDGMGVFTTAATSLLAEHGEGGWSNKGFLGALEVRMRMMVNQRPRLTCAKFRQYEPLLGGTLTRRAA